VPYSNWTKTYYCDPIPAELALPSDIRFREDLICLKRGKKVKVKFGNITSKNNKTKTSRKEGQRPLSQTLRKSELVL